MHYNMKQLPRDISCRKDWQSQKKLDPAILEPFVERQFRHTVDAQNENKQKKIIITTTQRKKATRRICAESPRPPRILFHIVRLQRFDNQNRERTLPFSLRKAIKRRRTC